MTLIISRRPRRETLCEHLFVTAQGSPLTRFRRAIERESLILAEIAATEAGYLSLDDALRLTGLYASAGDPKFERAAVRWLARFALEAVLPALPTRYRLPVLLLDATGMRVGELEALT